MKEKANNTNVKKFNSLIKEIANEKEDALEILYADYGRLIYSVAVSVTKSSFLADEIVDDVLVKIWHAAKKLKVIKNPVSWICKVTSNCAKDKLKKEKQCSEIYDIPQEDKNIEDLVINDAFLSYISTLNEDEQLIMILHYVQRLTFKLIAKEIHKPLSTVSSVHYRALAKLKQTIKKF